MKEGYLKFPSPTRGLFFYSAVPMYSASGHLGFRPLLGAYFFISDDWLNNMTLARFPSPTRGLFFYFITCSFLDYTYMFPSPTRGLFFYLCIICHAYTCKFFVSVPYSGLIFLSCLCKSACSKALHRILRRSPCHRPLTSVFFTAKTLPTQAASAAAQFTISLAALCAPRPCPTQF